jgi:hypothetical protein
MKYVPENYKDADLDEYFKYLEEKLGLFGSAQTTSLDLYKIAYDLIYYELHEDITLTSEELCIRLNELLNAPISHPYIDTQIWLVLGGIIEYKVILNDVLAEKLCKKLETTTDQDLIMRGYRYNSEKIARMSVDAGAKYLYDAYSNRQSDSFIQIKTLLDRDSKGRDILNQLYTVLIAGRMPIDGDHILAFYEETKTLSDRSKIQESLIKMVSANLESLVRKKQDPSVLMTHANELLRAVFNDKPDDIAEVKTVVKQLYWNEFDYADLKIESPKIYADVILQDEIKCQVVFEFLNAYKSFLANDDAQFNFQVNRLLSIMNALLTSDERSLLVNKLLSACVENRHVTGDTDLDIWLSLTLLLNAEKKNPAKFLIENRIKPMLKYFDEAYPRSKFLKNEANKEKFTIYLAEYAQEKTEYSKVASDALRVIKEHEKQAKQDVKRQQREEKRDTKESTDKPSTLSKIGGIIKKKNNDDDKNKKNKR